MGTCPWPRVNQSERRLRPGYCEWCGAMSEEPFCSRACRIAFERRWGRWDKTNCEPAPPTTDVLARNSALEQLAAENVRMEQTIRALQAELAKAQAGSETFRSKLERQAQDQEIERLRGKLRALECRIIDLTGHPVSKQRSSQIVDVTPRQPIYFLGPASTSKRRIPGQSVNAYPDAYDKP